VSERLAGDGGRALDGLEPVVEGRLPRVVERELHGRLERDLGIVVERDRLVRRRLLDFGGLDGRRGGLVERQIDPVRDLEERRLGFGEIGLDRRRVEGGVQLGLERQVVPVGAVARCGRCVNERGHQTELGVEQQRRVVAQGAVDEALHARADHASADDEIGVRRRDADAGSRADQQP